MSPQLIKCGAGSPPLSTPKIDSGSIRRRGKIELKVEFLPPREPKVAPDHSVIAGESASASLIGKFLVTSKEVATSWAKRSPNSMRPTPSPLVWLVPKGEAHEYIIKNHPNGLNSLIFVAGFLADFNP